MTQVPITETNLQSKSKSTSMKTSENSEAATGGVL